MSPPDGDKRLVTALMARSLAGDRCCFRHPEIFRSRIIQRIRGTRASGGLVRSGYYNQARGIPMSYSGQGAMQLPTGREHRLGAKHTLVGVRERTEQR